MKAQVRQCEDAINEVRVLSSLKHPYIVLEPQRQEHRLLQSCLDNWHLWISDTCGLRKMQTRRFESKHVKTMKNNETYHNEKYSTSVGGSKSFKPFLALQGFSRSLSIRGSLVHRFILCELGRSTENSSATEVVQRKLHRESELGYCDSS